MTPPRLFDWLLRRSLPPGPAGDSIRGDLIEELESSRHHRRARLRFRAHALSIVLRYRVLTPPVAEGRRRRNRIDTIRQEVRFAFRSLVKRPSFAVMVILTLALGIGANTAIFSLLHALVLRNLPVSDPSRLVVVSRNQLSLQYPLFRHFQAHSTTLDLLAFRTAAWRVTSADRTDRVTGALVSGSYFRVLGIQPALGTLIDDSDDAIPDAGGPRGPVAVLSHGFWLRQYGGQPTVIGAPILLNARPFTIVGVAPQSFSGTEVGGSPDVFAPMMLQPTLLPSLGSALTQPRSNWLRIIGRVRKDADVRRPNRS